MYTKGYLNIFIKQKKYLIFKCLPIIVVTNNHSRKLEYSVCGKDNMSISCIASIHFVQLFKL